MSSKPDGNDPRVLTKEGETVKISSTSSQTGKSVYHTTDCFNLKQMNNPTEVDIGVAKWKGYEHCKDCIDPDVSKVSTLSGNQVDQIRRALAECDVKPNVVSEGYDVCHTSIRKHAKGVENYNYRTEPELPPVEYNGHSWVWADE